MIVSIHIKNETSEQLVPIKLSNLSSEKFKVVDYHQTSKQLLDLPNVRGVIIPGSIDDLYQKNDYDPVLLIQHIRLLQDSSIARLPIFIPDDYYLSLDSNSPIFDQEVELLSDCSNQYELISEDHHEKSIKMIKDEHNLPKHDLANKWGPYRVLNQMNEFGLASIEREDLEFVEDKLSEQFFLKKLLYLSKVAKNWQNPLPAKIAMFKRILDPIRSMNLKIVIIDDEVSSGWGKAYGAIFNFKGVVSLYPEPEKQDVSDPQRREEIFTNFYSDLDNIKDKLKKADLILLDLRLHEKAVHDSTEIMNIENTSGIKVLKKIKNILPQVPVIMCTASNKSWSYEATINLGADGFWCKESPDFGTSPDYSFFNTLDLIKTIHDVTAWSKKIRPIFEALLELFDSVKMQNLAAANSIKRKAQIIYSLLYYNRSQFVEQQFGRSGLQMAFLTLFSLVNEILTLSKKEREDDIYVEYGSHSYKFCEVESINGMMRFDLSQDATDTLPYYITRYGTNSKFFPEKNFIYFFMLKVDFNVNIDEYKRLSKIRNNLDVIHKHTEDELATSTNKLILDDLYSLLKIYYSLFTQKEFRI
jgi:DNA-binding NarL/FixJ family response regulator